MFISIGIDENGKPFVTTSDKSEKPSRPNKGHSLIAAPDTYTVIDIETTGLDSRYCEIIELSALRYSNGSLVDSFTTLVKPTEPIDSFITELTGITNDLVADAPAISDAIKSFYDFVGSDILVGYNVNFDINFIYDVLQDTHSIDFTNSFVDVMRFARKLLPELKNHKLETVAAHYKVSSPAHRSYADCEACNTCYQALLTRGLRDRLRARKRHPRGQGMGCAHRLPLQGRRAGGRGGDPKSSLLTSKKAAEPLFEGDCSPRQRTRRRRARLRAERRFF